MGQCELNTFVTMMRIFAILLLLSCNQKPGASSKTLTQSLNTYSVFDTSIHLLPEFERTKFDTMHNWNFGWNLLEPINLATDHENSEIQLSKRLSPGQKALYFIWYLDAEVTNGGFIQFYWNGYQKYIPPIINGLRLIGDDEMLSLVQKADQEYLNDEKEFEKQRRSDHWSPLYENLKTFSVYDSIYYNIHDATMQKIEKYARKHADEFVMLK
jgi:hypothetical protein